MRTCKKAQMLAVLAEYGALSDQEKAFLEEHIRVCPTCREFSLQIENLKTGLDRYKAPSSELTLDRLPDPEGLSGRFRGTAKNWIWGIGSLIIVLIALFAFRTGLIRFNRPEDMPVTRGTVVSPDYNADMLRNLDLYRDNELFSNLELLNSLEEYI